MINKCPEVSVGECFRIAVSSSSRYLHLCVLTTDHVQQVVLKCVCRVCEPVFMIKFLSVALNKKETFVFGNICSTVIK